MKPSPSRSWLSLAPIVLAISVLPAAPSVDIRIECDKPRASLSPVLYGLFFEDINYGADGGLYAELIQNRSFEYHPIKVKAQVPLFAWEKVERDGARVEASVVKDRPLNSKNPNHLELKITQAGQAGIANTGFDGIHLDEGASYDLSLFARTLEWSGNADLAVTLEDKDGSPCGAFVFKDVGSEWNKYTGVITSSKKAENARLVVTAKGAGTLDLDMVSLFPQDTYKGRKNGLRRDLVEALKELNPKFLRFPGGCASHGNAISNMYRWKDSIGPVEVRKPNWSIWGYHQTYGLGFFEYFQLCEDLGMEALPVVPVGVTCGFAKYEFVPMADLQPHIQDAVDLIEFANGPATSRWGAERAKMGHPEPFNIKYISLGNEEHDTPQFRERFPLFSEAVRKAHPGIKIVGTSGLGTRPPLYGLMGDLKVYSSDEHYYEPPNWFIRNQNRFDNFDRSQPKIFVGEYAAHDTGRRNTLFSALSEATYLTGIERNGDIVDMTCYAPLLAREGHTQWSPDLIYFNKRQVLRSSNYHVQKLFGQNKGDTYLSNSCRSAGETAAPTVSGCLGIGSWSTAFQVAEAKVNGLKLDLPSWKVVAGDFDEREGVFTQTNTRLQPALTLSRDTYSGESVTYALRLWKTSGDEGFLVRFGADREGRGGYWLNLGGWGNSRHAIEEFVGNGKVEVASAPGRIEQGRWYDVRVEMTPGLVRCYLDNARILEHRTGQVSLSLSPTMDRSNGELFIKLVNPALEAVTTRIVLAGATSVPPTARLITLAGDKASVNTFAQPDLVRPVESEIKTAAEFAHTVPPMSMQVIRLKLK